jgi:CubicO group peptidase (beta-lactamase class C family)
VKPVAAQDLLPRVDELFAKWDRQDSPGCSIGVVQDGELVLERHYGSADIEHAVPISSDTLYDIASISKQFTAACVVRLDQAGTISIEDDVRKYVPELHDFGLRLSHLVHHTSGLRDYLSLTSLMGVRDGTPFTVDDFLDLVGRQRNLNFRPGEKYTYCNTGYVLLSIVVSRAGGRAFPDFARTEVLEPAGMTRSLFRLDHTAVIPGLCRFYRRSGDAWVKAEHADDVAGDGGLISGLHDLVAWDGYLRREPGFTALMERVGTPEDGKEKYAYGLSIGEYRQRRMVSHGGALSGFRGEFMRLPEEGLTVIVLGNVGGFNADGLARQVTDLVLGNVASQAKAAPAPADEGAASPDEELTGLFLDPEAGLTVDVELGENGPVAKIQTLVLPLRRLHGNRFVTEHEVYNLELEFEPAGDEPKRWKLYLAGEVLYTLAEVTPVELDDAQLAAYAGAYHSDELGSRFEVSVDDGRLLVRRATPDKVALRSTGSDEFSAPFGRVGFSRDGAGAVTRFVVYGGRVSGVGFEKVG